MNRPELDQDRRANTQSGQPIGAEDLHATVSDGAGAPEEARIIPDARNHQKAEFVHPRTSPLPPEEASEASQLRAEKGSAAIPMDEVTSNVNESELRPSVWEATGRGRSSYEDKDAPEPD
jgi:hypothetical protein